jgi:uncharacterized integral membrane protein
MTSWFLSFNFIFIIILLIIAILAAYVSFTYINKDQEDLPRALISVGAFFTNIWYFIKIGFLKLIGYKWYKKNK